MASEPILLVAAGGLAREALAALTASGKQHAIGILDDDRRLHGSDFCGITVLGGVDSVGPYDASILICAGSGVTRASIFDRLTARGVSGEQYATVIHSTVSASASSMIGLGSILLANVVLTSDVLIGRHVVVMPNSTLTHDVVVDDFATICSGVSLGGAVRVGRRAYLGMNSSVRQRIHVGEQAVLGMGAALTRDLPAGATWVGVPARQITNDRDQLNAGRGSAPTPSTDVPTGVLR